MKVETEELLFNLTNSKHIEIVTGDKAVANFLGISCKKLGYVSDEEVKDEAMKNIGEL